jgi:hypothetical protein
MKELEKLLNSIIDCLYLAYSIKYFDRKKRVVRHLGLSRICMLRQERGHANFLF